MWLLIKRLEPFVHHIKTIIILQIYKCYLTVFVLYARSEMHPTPISPPSLPPLFFCLSQYKTQPRP